MKFGNGIIAFMTSLQKRIFFILLAIGSLYFILFVSPNNTGAKDQMMISLFEPDIILLWSQRIADYTQEGAQESAVDPAAFEDTYQFYMDVKNESLRGYKLVYRNSEGLLFVSEELYAQYFE